MCKQIQQGMLMLSKTNLRNTGKQQAQETSEQFVVENSMESTELSLVRGMGKR